MLKMYLHELSIFTLFLHPLLQWSTGKSILSSIFFSMYTNYMFSNKTFTVTRYLCLNVSGIHVKKPLQNSWRTTGFLNLGVIYASFLTGRNLLINKKDKNSRYTNIKHGDNSMHKTNNLKKNLIDKAK